MPEPEKLIPLHGGYRKLKSFQVAQLVYDVTVRFCDRYIDERSRTHDLLDRQVEAQAAAFMKEGGFTERLYRGRSRQRK
ncbi:MAG TPA: four helix bundle suffix domain-containing protein [Verrucomicrobiae bacterium]